MRLRLRLPHEQVGEIFYWNVARKSQLKPKREPYKALQHLCNGRETREACAPLFFFLAPWFAILCL